MRTLHFKQIIFFLAFNLDWFCDDLELVPPSVDIVLGLVVVQSFPPDVRGVDIRIGEAQD